MTISRRTFLASSALLAATRPASGSTSPSAPTRIKQLIDDTPYWLAATGTSGISITLIEAGRIVDSLAFGTTEPDGGERVTDATIFQAASLSKQALLYAALRTVEADKLDLDRPLVRYMEKAPDLPEAGLEHIAARHVLTHTTGWPNWPSDDGPFKPVRLLGAWGYSGAGFMLLQQALESIWGEPAARYTRRLVLDPLGMRTSDFVWRDEYQRTAVRGYQRDGTAAEPWHPDRPNGASSLHTTSREYGRLLEAFLAPGLRRRHPEVYHKQVAIDARLGWSLGWGTAVGILWQWGHSNGFRTFAALRPAGGLGIVSLANGAGGQRVNREWVNGWLGRSLEAFFFESVEL